MATAPGSQSTSATSPIALAAFSHQRGAPRYHLVQLQRWRHDILEIGVDRGAPYADGLSACTSRLPIQPLQLLPRSERPGPNPGDDRIGTILRHGVQGRAWL